MSFEFEYHPQGLMILPFLGLAAGECEDPQCEAEHYLITIGWLFWSLEIVFQMGGGTAP